tara:strand:- start:2273 stop:3205 length:933 start_codon:yes stop_codon:yes gene_type:complete
MNILRSILFLLIFFTFSVNLYANSVEIVVKVQNEIITNIDIQSEKKYLLFLNPNLQDLDKIKVNEIAKNSLITEIIKKKELEKAYNFNETNNVINAIENNYLKMKNIKNKNQFIQILNDKNIDYEMFRNKLKIEALWNQLVYRKYGNNIVIDEENLKKRILNEFKNKKKKYEYNLSEIYFNQSVNENLEDTLAKLNNSINEIGFENTANIYSISSTSKNGGLIGWINELQISEIIKKNINKLGDNEVSKPIKLKNGYLLIKVNSKREFKEEIDVDAQVKELANKEMNRQLNSFSMIFFKRLKKNIQINEL